jgi:hypothetical protein
MRIPIAIVIAGLLLAGAILFVFRWQISATPGVVYELDRWNGDIFICPWNEARPCDRITDLR